MAPPAAPGEAGRPLRQQGARRPWGPVWVQQLVERGGCDPVDRLLAADQPVLRHLDGDAERGGGGALARAGLQHVQRVLLDRELDVLHVAVVPLQRVAYPQQLGIGLRQHHLHRQLVRPGAGLRHRLRGAYAGDHVLALGVHQILAVEDVLAGGRVAGEADAGGAVGAHVAEHHGLDVHRRAPVGRDVVQAAVGVGARVHPGAEHRADRAPELLRGRLRERAAGVVCDQVLVGLDHLPPAGGAELGVLGHARARSCGPR